MIIRKAVNGDLEDLTKLFDAYRIFYEKPSDPDGARKFLSNRISTGDATIFVATLLEPQLAGFVQLYPLFSSTRMEKLWLLNDLFVDKQYRGKGISVALLEESKQFCRQTGACGIILETAKSNEVGNRLYPKTGFTLDTDHNYYFWDNG